MSEAGATVSDSLLTVSIDNICRTCVYYLCCICSDTVGLVQPCVVLQMRVPQHARFAVDLRYAFSLLVM